MQGSRKYLNMILQRSRDVMSGPLSLSLSLSLSLLPSLPPSAVVPLDPLGRCSGSPMERTQPEERGERKEEGNVRKCEGEKERRRWNGRRRKENFGALGKRCALNLMSDIQSLKQTSRILRHCWDA